MAYYDYRFVTHWRVRGKQDQVYRILKEGTEYSRWWKPAYLSSKEVGPKKVTALVRAKLPYTLEFTTQLVREEEPRELEIRSSGELAGTGTWKLRQDGEFTQIEFHWNVCAEKALVRWLSFLLKPLFVWNHHWVMNTGEKALQAEIDRRAL